VSDVAWQAFLGQPRRDLSLAHGALLIASAAYPALDVDAQLRQLDDLAATLKARLPADIARSGTLAALNRYLFEELGFKGNQADYYDPRNSYLNEVLERKLGIPITLSVIYIEVGRRLGLPLQGVSFPGHFLVKCALRDGTAVIDPYAGGASLGIKDLQTRVRAMTGGRDVPPEAVMSMLAASPPAEILARMLRNLRGIHAERGDREQALEAANRVIDLAPESPDDFQVRSRLLEELECFRAALMDLETCLKLAPERPDAHALGVRAARLREKAARLN
jgi:regulator of sirC expression with transglutaminase-like and TPR domain